MHSTIHAVCGQQKGQNRANDILNFFFFFFSQKGRALFRLFQKGRASRKGGRASRKGGRASRKGGRASRKGGRAPCPAKEA